MNGAAVGRQPGDDRRPSVGNGTGQGDGRRFVVGLEGSESNVIGLPLEETLALLAASEAGP